HRCDRFADGGGIGGAVQHAHAVILPRTPLSRPCSAVADYAGRVSTQRVFVARLAGCAIFDPVGDRLGKVRDVVIVYRSTVAPRVIGLVIEIPGRRQVFMSIGRVTSIRSGQVLTTGLINVRRFQPRPGEVRVLSEMLGRRVELADGSGSAVIEDV